MPDSAEKVNLQGGAIAGRNSLGVKGVRPTAAVLSTAKRTGEKLIATSMCIGFQAEDGVSSFSSLLLIYHLLSQLVYLLLGYGFYRYQRAIDLLLL